MVIQRCLEHLALVNAQQQQISFECIFWVSEGKFHYYYAYTPRPRPPYAFVSNHFRWRLKGKKAFIPIVSLSICVGSPFLLMYYLFSRGNWVQRRNQSSMWPRPLIKRRLCRSCSYPDNHHRSSWSSLRNPSMKTFRYHWYCAAVLSF